MAAKVDAVLTVAVAGMHLGAASTTQQQTIGRLINKIPNSYSINIIHGEPILGSKSKPQSTFFGKEK